MAYDTITGPFQPDQIVKMHPGQAVAGAPVGILVLDLNYAIMPGNVANATTYDFPVLYKVLRGTTIPQILSADASLLDLIVGGGKELIQQGARTIIGSCGYFGNFQIDASAALDVPVYLSSLLQIPMITQGLKANEKLGVICAVEESFSPKLRENCNITDTSRYLVKGAQELPEFQYILNCAGGFNSGKLEQEMVGLAKEFVAEHPEISAILLECSDMPPYAYAIQQALKMPVFDFTTMIDWVHRAVVRRPFTGIV